ncbi:hypothetical protein XELAEV_18000832mg [Xenopus laevis]|nr:hypothetical protein XELAEV_18000832mg [Xenopus laevis]
MDLLEEIFETLNTSAWRGTCTVWYPQPGLIQSRGQPILQNGERDRSHGSFHGLETTDHSINPTSDEDLSINQPRDYSLWYLQEEDEEPPDFFNAESAPSTSEIKLQLTPDYLTDRSLPKANVCSAKLEVLSITTKVTTHTHQTIIPSAEAEIPPTTKEESKPAPGLPFGQLSGCSISRFQALDLDRRMTWKGNRKEENQPQRAIRWNYQQLQNMQQANSPNSINMNSTQKLNTQSNNIPTSSTQRGIDAPNTHLENLTVREPGAPSREVVRI